MERRRERKRGRREGEKEVKNVTPVTAAEKAHFCNLAFLGVVNIHPNPYFYLFLSNFSYSFQTDAPPIPFWE